MGHITLWSAAVIVGGIMASALSRIIADDVKQNADSIAFWILKAGLLFVDKADRDRYEEEGKAGILEKNGCFPKIFWAAGLVIAAPRMPRRSTEPRGAKTRSLLGELRVILEPWREINVLVNDGKFLEIESEGRVYRTTSRILRDHILREAAKLERDALEKESKKQ